MNNHELLMSTPTFAKTVYQSLPSFLRELTERFEEPREKDIILSSAIAMIGGCVANNISGNYQGDWVSPNLYLFIVAPAASGKSKMKYSKHLGGTIQEEFKKANLKAKKDFKLKMFVWEDEARKSKALAGPQPDDPKYPYLFVPGNSSAAALYNSLDQNDGNGIICETEADTLSNAISQWWGDFSDLLRSSFQHESLNRRRSSNDEYITIEHPRLTTILSGTPDQVARLISSTEDGLYSRFLFYCFMRDLKWLDPNPKRNNEDLNLVFKKAGEVINEVKKEMGKRKYIFTFSDSQFEQMGPFFKDKLSLLRLFEGAGAASVVYRLGLIAFRIAMILTVTRNMGAINTTTDFECSDTDFETTMSLIDVFFTHSMTMYSLLPTKSHSGMNPKLREFYSALPYNKELLRKNLNEIAAVLKIGERTVNNYINKLLERKLLISPKYGVYLKLTLDDNNLEGWQTWQPYA